MTKEKELRCHGREGVDSSLTDQHLLKICICIWWQRIWPQRIPLEVGLMIRAKVLSWRERPMVIQTQGAEIAR